MEMIMGKPGKKTQACSLLNTAKPHHIWPSDPQGPAHLHLGTEN